MEHCIIFVQEKQYIIEEMCFAFLHRSVMKEYEIIIDQLLGMFLI